jgi:hypothetical protein
VEDDGRVISTTIVSRWQWGNEDAKRRLAERLRAAGHRDVRALGDGDRVTVAAE